jgi:hypothetical protein
MPTTGSLRPLIAPLRASIVNATSVHERSNAASCSRIKAAKHDANRLQITRELRLVGTAAPPLRATSKSTGNFVKGSPVFAILYAILERAKPHRPHDSGIIMVFSVLRDGLRDLPWQLAVLHIAAFGTSTRSP